MKVVLRYTDCMQDGRNVFNTLSVKNVEILKTKIEKYSIYPKITIRVKDMYELNQLIAALNRNCVYEVSVVKVKSEDGLIKRVKRIFS